MSYLNYKRTYTSSEDIANACRRRRSALNIFNKELSTPNESAEFARAQMLKRKGLGGTTIYITLEEEARLNASFTNGEINEQQIDGQIVTSTSNTSAGIEYINKCPFVYRRKTVLPLTNKF
jgi:hypothetical protein